MDCIFCKIINDEIPSKTIYENDYVKAFLDIQPLSKGHVLVVTKKHYVNLTDMPDNELLEIMRAINYLYPRMENILDCSGFHFIENYGTCQEIKHVHFHIIPKYDGETPLISNHTKSDIDIEQVYNSLLVK